MHRTQARKDHIQTLPPMTSLFAPADELINRGGGGHFRIWPNPVTAATRQRARYWAKLDRVSLWRWRRFVALEWTLAANFAVMHHTVSFDASHSTMW